MTKSNDDSAVRADFVASYRKAEVAGNLNGALDVRDTGKGRAYGHKEETSK